MPAESWVSVEGVTPHLGVSYVTVYRGMEADGLPAHKVDRRWKFKLADVCQRVHTARASDDPDRTEDPE